MKCPFKNSKKGDKVYSLSFGKGKIRIITTGTLMVDFRNADSQYYYLNGVSLFFGEKRDLYLKKPIITSKDRLNYLLNRKKPKKKQLKASCSTENQIQNPTDCTLTRPFVLKQDDELSTDFFNQR